MLLMVGFSFPTVFQSIHIMSHLQKKYQDQHHQHHCTHHPPETPINEHAQILSQGFGFCPICNFHLTDLNVIQTNPLSDKILHQYHRITDISDDQVVIFQTPYKQWRAPPA